MSLRIADLILRAVGFLFVYFCPVLASGSMDEWFFNDGPTVFETHLNEIDFEHARMLPSRSAPKGHRYPNDPLSQAFRSGKFEGDIIGVGRENVTDFVKSSVKSPKNGSAKYNYNAIRNPYALWTNGVIPYALSSQYSAYARAVIAAAIMTYHKKTCIKFVPRTSEQDYVFLAPMGGCYSMVGRSRGQQLVSLGQGCVFQATVEHELMHAVGFFHEQSRADRDEFITIAWHNVVPGSESQFMKYSLQTITHLGVPYDYDSVMHYGPNAFSRNGQPTIIPKKLGQKIGQKDGLSVTDLLKINKLYECNGPQPEEPSTTLATTLTTSTSPPASETTTLPDSTEQNKGIRPGGRRVSPTVTPQPRWVRTTTTAPPWRSSSTQTTTTTENPNKGGGKGGEGGGEDKLPWARRCVNYRDECRFWSNIGHCTEFESWMRINCAKSCGFCEGDTKSVWPFPTAPPPTTTTTTTSTSTTTTTIRTTTKDIQEPLPSPRPIPLPGSCLDDSIWCSWWSKAGFCRGIFKNYMALSCRRSCTNCFGGDV